MSPLRHFSPDSRRSLREMRKAAQNVVWCAYMHNSITPLHAYKEIAACATFLKKDQERNKINSARILPTTQLHALPNVETRVGFRFRVSRSRSSVARKFIYPQSRRGKLRVLSAASGRALSDFHFGNEVSYQRDQWSPLNIYEYPSYSYSWKLVAVHTRYRFRDECVTRRCSSFIDSSSCSSSSPSSSAYSHKREQSRYKLRD